MVYFVPTTQYVKPATLYCMSCEGCSSALYQANGPFSELTCDIHLRFQWELCRGFKFSHKHRLTVSPPQRVSASWITIMFVIITSYDMLPRRCISVSQKGHGYCYRTYVLCFCSLYTDFCNECLFPLRYDPLTSNPKKYANDLMTCISGYTVWWLLLWCLWKLRVHNIHNKII